MGEIVIQVPGALPDGIAFLDLETRKVPVNSHRGITLPNGSILRLRWAAFAAGIASHSRQGSRITLLHDNSEGQLLPRIALEVQDHTIRYAATRQFDEMVMKGRFTNARQKHALEAFFPAMPGADGLEWQNIYADLKSEVNRSDRAPDVASRDVPKAWERGQHTVVLIHLLRDVCELLLASDDVSIMTYTWCMRVLRDTGYATRMLECRE
jgi:hypothetical protein